MTKKTKDIKTLADLTPDGENFNRHTEFGSKLLEDSLRKFGAGRSVLVDKDGNIIAGNGVVETAAGIGMDDVVVVQTDGKKLVVVQRTDLELDSKEGRELALADNMTALKGIDKKIDWSAFIFESVRICRDAGLPFYIKKDLQIHNRGVYLSGDEINEDFLNI